jgi:predicted transcriptional regulator
MDKPGQNSVTGLQQLGFNETEARLYVALLQHEPLTGYELAKTSGVPRANVYGVLRKLEQRGAVARVEASGGRRYAAVPFNEVLDKLRERYEQAMAHSRAALESLTPAAAQTPVSQFTGYANLVETGRQLLRYTSQRLLLAIWPEEAKAVGDEMDQADRRGVEITTLCLAGCRSECGYCRGYICRYPFGLDQALTQERWLLLVADSEELLAGSVLPPEQTTALRTRQLFLVQFASGYIRNSMAIATLITDFDLHLDEALKPEAQAALARLLPLGVQDSWLDHMRGLLLQRREP